METSGVDEEHEKYFTSIALRLSRKQRLESVVLKRKNNFVYISKIHLGGYFFLNCVLLSKEFIHRYSTNTVPVARTNSYFYLGMGLANVLNASLSGSSFVKAVSQLMEEFEYHSSSIAMQSMKYVLAKTTATPFYPFGTVLESEASFLHKFNGEVIYEYLRTPELAIELNYSEVLRSLCELFIQIYDGFLHEDSFRFSTN